MGRISVIPILARRFLLSKVSDRFLSLITWVSVIGVALGVVALVVVTSAINGFETELIRVITGMNGDVVLYSRGDPIRDPALVESKIRKVVPEAQAVSASFVTELMISGPHGVAGAVLEGIDSETIGTTTMIPERVFSGRFPVQDGEIALGSAIADKVGAEVGSEVRLVAPFLGDPGASESSPESLQATPKVQQVKVVGITKMGMYEYDSKFAFTPLGAIQRFLDQPGRVTSFRVKLKPGVDSRRISDRLSDSFGYPFRAKDWGQLNKNLFYAIKLEKAVIAVTLTVIVVVAAFNVVSALMMMVHDKTREIAILKAMGLRPAQSFLLFCLIGMGIGAVGTSAGVLGGLVLNWILKESRLIQLPSEIYYIGFLPVVVRWNEVAWIVGVALFITFFATLYPAIKVSTRPPLEGLRYE